jgi:hypothetical protein
LVREALIIRALEIFFEVLDAGVTGIPMSGRRGAWRAGGWRSRQVGFDLIAEDQQDSS